MVLQTTREQKGQEIYVQGKITKLDESTFLVPSQSREGKYKVESIGDSWACECPDFQFRADKIGECKHIIALRLWLKLQPKQIEKIIIQTVTCKFCGSSEVIRYGIESNKQVHKCKACGRKFVEDNGFKQHRFNPEVITATLDLYFKGISLRKITDHLAQFYGITVNFSTLYRWISRYTKLLSEYVDKQIPQLSGQWHADEMMVRCEGEWKYLWNVMDKDTRFMLASQITKGREITDATRLFNKAKRIAKSIPKVIVTDGLASYQGAWLNSFGRTNREVPKHLRKIAFNGKHNNNLVERLNGTKRERDKVLRGMKKNGTPIRQGFDIYYNYIRPHQALGGRTPAEMANINLNLNGNRWLGLIQQSVRQRECNTVNEHR